MSVTDSIIPEFYQALKEEIRLYSIENETFTNWFWEHHSLDIYIKKEKPTNVFWGRKVTYRLISLMNPDALKPAIYKRQYITTK